jgi:hypothetical protein
LIQSASRRAFLLSVLDADTQQRVPEAARLAALPTLAELERTVDIVARAMVADRAAGQEPELVFFFSGHGLRDEHGEAALSVLDGGLTRSWLYERLLARVPARVIHVIIDACHAAALVRPRDVNAKLETLDESERQAHVDAVTLDRFPNVGVVLASSASAQSFEWDSYRSGVFAHQLLSALRGGADVNGDGRVEYSETAAFLAAANLRVRDARARLDIVVRPPRLDRRAPLLELAALKGQFELRGRADGPWHGGIFVETESGERLLDVFPERGARLSLRLPVGRRLFVVRSDGEAELFVRTAQPVALSSLRMSVPRARPRGALDTALRQGLFAAPFGPAFYQGYVSQRDELVAVPFGDDADEEHEATASHAGVRRPLGAVLLGVSGAGLITTGILGYLTLEAKADYESTDLERPAEQARQRYYDYRAAALVAGSATVALGAAGALLLLLPDGTEAHVESLAEGGWLLEARRAF